MLWRQREEERKGSKMEGGGINYRIRKVEEVFSDFQGRRTAIIRALTTDVDALYQRCDPGRENLCLYGFPSGHWVVNLPAEEVPAEIPEPVLGINFARDGMQRRDWLSLIAVHSDTWLLSVAFFFGARFGFNNVDRMRLFSLINALPTIYETVFGPVNKHGREKPRSSYKKSKESQSKHTKLAPLKEEGEIVEEEEEEEEEAEEDKEEEAEEGIEEEEEEHGETETFCGACDETYAPNEFWICCDVCEIWFHGKCVRITPARAEHIKQFRCPSCCGNKRVRA